MSDKPNLTVSKPNLVKEETLASLLRRPDYADRFKQVLGDRAGEFTSSVLSVGMSMPDVEPIGIVQSAMKAAALSLPVEKSLGFAWIVPFNERQRDGSYKKVAQFQIGYKGFIQLALRTAAYSRMNVRPINEEAFDGYDDVGEPIILWNNVDETKPPVGYAFAWKLVNGFTKVCYWSKDKVEIHAKRYSQAYAKGYSTPWKTHFDAMAMKTVVKNELSRWGILSIQFQRALELDQSVTDLAGTRYPDSSDIMLTDEKPELLEGGGDSEDPAPSEAKEPKSAKKVATPPAAEPQPTPAASEPEDQSEIPLRLAQTVAVMGVTEEDFLSFVSSTGVFPGADKLPEIADLPTDVCARMLADKAALAKCKRTFSNKA